MDIPLKVIGER